MYTLDTNAVLYYLHGDQTVRSIIDDAIQNGVSLYISAITIAELLRYPKLGSTEEAGIRTFIRVCSVINVDTSVADQAGTIGRMYNLKLADSIIAVTALFTSSRLLTRNVRDFKRLSMLDVEKI